MKKLLVLNIIGAIAINESVASTINPNSGTGAGSASCTNAVVETFDGNTSYAANWQPNTIQLSWYSDGTELDVDDASKSCQYDGAMVIPTQPSKTGYTFMGWTVRDHNLPSGGGNSGGAQQCSLAGLDTDIGGNGHGYRADSTGANGAKSLNADTYGLTTDNTWATEFSYGIVKGASYCSGKSGDGHNGAWGGNSADWTATESELTSASGEKSYCWCKPTNYTPDGGSQCSVVSLWVFNQYLWSPDDCAYGCANYCSSSSQYVAAFRQALFNTSAQ